MHNFSIFAPICKKLVPAKIGIGNVPYATVIEHLGLEPTSMNKNVEGCRDGSAHKLDIWMTVCRQHRGPHKAVSSNPTTKLSTCCITEK